MGDQARDGPAPGLWHEPRGLAEGTRRDTP